MSATKPGPTEYAPYYEKYLQLAGEGDLLKVLQTQLDDFKKFARGIPESQGDVVHQPYAWTVKQVIGHVIDGERIFAYRLLRVARGDATPLPGFEEGDYVKVAGYDKLSVQDLVQEFESVRRATLTLIDNMPDDAWPRKGTANSYTVSARALAWIIVGHAKHHIEILKKRLGLAPSQARATVGAS